MAKTTKLNDKVKIRGIRRRWLLNSVSVVALIIVLAVGAFTAALINYDYSDTADDLDKEAASTANGFRLYTRSDYRTAAQQTVNSYEEKGRLELQFLDTGGAVLYSGNDLTAGSMPSTPEIQRALESRTAASWQGRDPSTGERILAASSPVIYQGETVGVIRYVTSLSDIDRQFVLSMVIIVTIALAIFSMVYFSNLYFVRSIVEPLAAITEIARVIADGSYGVQIEKKYDDEIGELTDAINDMSLKIRQSEKTQSEFISSVSHELRTPLTAIKGWAETLQEGADPGTAEKGMNVIIRESERLSGLVEELLDFSRLQNGRMRLLVSRMDLLAELDEAVYMFTDRARTEGKTLHYEENAFLPPVYGDVDRLRQVFVNILDNALKYTSPGGTITVSSRADDWVRVSIADTGCGIPAEHLPNVKKKFYKANQLVRGSGIGLAVADEIVAMHGGSLSIESQEGVGTTVTISLPTCALLEENPQLAENPEIGKFIQERNQNAYE